jgi:hypothetical protein
MIVYQMICNPRLITIFPYLNPRSYYLKNFDDVKWQQKPLETKTRKIVKNLTAWFNMHDGFIVI